MKKRITFLLALVAHLAISSLSAQVRMQMPVGTHEFSNKKTSTVLPFMLKDNLVVVDVELNGISMNLVLDSGMPMDGAILHGSSKVDSAKLNFSLKMPVKGIGGNAVLSDVCMGATLKVPDLTFSNQMIIVVPYDSDRSLHFEGHDGIIGFSFFGHLLVGIDYEKQLLTLSQPGTINENDLGQKIPVEVRANRIFVKADVQLESGPTIPAELVIDTGNRAALTLNTRSTQGLILPDRTISYYARGLTAKISRKMGRIKAFKIGNYHLSNVLASFNDDSTGARPPWEKEGNLGSQILSRFTATFDIPGGQIFLKKNGWFDEPFEYNMAGIQVERASDKTFTVINVITDSPADKHIQVGDKITMVNEKPSSKMTKDELEKVFKKYASEVSLVIERSGEQIKVKLKLERII
jgi:hypothetical protein